jgi:hypothetical protein
MPRLIANICSKLRPDLRGLVPFACRDGAYDQRRDLEDDDRDAVLRVRDIEAEYGRREAVALHHHRPRKARISGNHFGGKILPFGTF